MKKTSSTILCAAAAAAMLVSCTTAEPVDTSLAREHSDAMESAVAAYVAEAQAENVAINTIMVLQHGKVLGEAYVNGWTPEMPHHMWSTSKSFTSLAVGFAIEEGLLSLDDKLAGFFPKIADKALSQTEDSAYKENLQACTVKDLLVMSSGHDREPVFSEVEKMQEMAVALGKELSPGDNLENLEPALKELGIDLKEKFFTTPFVNKPGTKNLYNSPATYMLSAIVQKVTGEKVNDYLKPRLWDALGMEQPEWQELDGVNCGGWGLFLTPEEMAKAGQMFLCGGRYAGKQVVPEAYLKEATTPYFKWGWPEWDPQQRGRGPHNGYGYQFWTFTEGFNTAGAQGQFILVMPEFDAVVVCTAQIHDGDFRETNLIWKHIVPVLASETRRTVEIDGALGKLRGDIRIPQEAVSGGQKVPMVIICHGLTASRNEPLLNGTAISAQRLGIASAKFDFNGHGESDGRFVDMSIVNEEEDLEKIYEYVKSLDFVDPARIAVLGHSQGGAIVSMFAGRHPELGGLILCAAATAEIPMDMSRMEAGLPGDYPDNIPDSLQFIGPHFIGKEYMKAAMESDPLADLANYKGPVCVLHGTDDDMVPPYCAKLFKLVAPQAEVHMFEGLKHGFQPDEQQAIDAAADFLKRTL